MGTGQRLPAAGSGDLDGATVAVGRRLRELRRQKGLTQEELASRAHTHPVEVGRVERGTRDPRLTTLVRMAGGLGVEPGELLDDVS